ncbi:glycosyltransferase family 4 protein [Aggregatilinea lenta]|uniref:glycosyltransferase family 4 protein n=1 Tax=Aggregatilinea lenta TaxID=913108 RepID=UPI000E5B14DA|nr:glycosyltransferase family 4 protein [Aggregatilinea lenta]
MNPQSQHFLFVVTFYSDLVGGHLLSALELGECLYNRGHTVGLLAKPFDLPDLTGTHIRLHKSPYKKSSVTSHIRRIRDIGTVVRKYQYNVLVAMEPYAARHAGIIAGLYGLPMIQILPGGRVPGRSAPLKLPGIVVFSQELFDGLQNQHNISPNDILLSRGRIDFKRFQEVPRSVNDHSLGFNDSSQRILAISRLTPEKSKALFALLDQVECAAAGRPVQLIIIGEGQARPRLEERAREISQRTGPAATIKFTGFLRVQPSHLRQADLVVGQGRTVLEAIAAGTPAAVSGSNGYHGLLTFATLPLLERTNLTGRSLPPKGDLLSDLQRLTEYRQNDFFSFRNKVIEMYDANSGARVIEEALALILARHSTPWQLRVQLTSAWAGELQRMCRY